MADKRRAVFRSYLAVEELVAVAHQRCTSKRMLDVGGAFGIHARFFRERCPGLQVDILDVKPGTEKLVFEGSYFDFVPAEPYDFLWCSHVVEHLRNPGLFFDKVYRDVRDGGWVGITVPPLKSEMTFQHVTLWNAGLLLIHLIHAGFDCSDAHIATYGYNVSVVVQKKARGNGGKHCALPAVAYKGEYFVGDIKRLNWMTNEVRPPAFGEALGKVEEVECELIEAKSPSSFFYAHDKKNRPRLCYYESSTANVYLAG